MRGLKWSRKEIVCLRNNYKKSSSTQIRLFYFPYRTSKSIQRKLQELNLKREVSKLWTQQEVRYLKANYGKISSIKIAKKLKRTILSIYSKGEKIGLKCKNKIYFSPREKDYSKEEDKILKKFWGKIKAKQIRSNFLQNRTCNSLHHRANRLELHSSTYIGYGKNNPNYKHGKSREPYPLEWNDNFKEEIRKRDKYCKICKKLCPFRKLCVHHIDRNKLNLKKINLISLCLYHHSKISRIQNDLQDHFHAINMGLIA